MFLENDKRILSNRLDISSYELSEGEYSYDIIVETNDYENSLITIPIMLTVIEDSCSDWSTGDLNQDSELNVLDVTIMISIALNLIETDDCQYAASDLNQDGTVNVLDILALVSLILN